MVHTSKYFYGNKISDEGLKNKRVDYATFSKAFDAVLNNDILQALNKAGYYFDEVNTEEFYDNDGNYYTSEEAEEKREELQERAEAIEDELTELQEDEAANAARIAELEEEADSIEKNIESLEDPHYKDIYQYYIVSDNAKELLDEAGEAYFYNEELDMIIWGVDHWGTSWDYVMTSIKLELENE